jgi:hypothetical protein
MKTFLLVPVYLALTASSMARISPQTSPEKPSRPMQQDSQPASLASSMNKGKTRLTGCVRSKDGKYFLEAGPHKTIWLSGPTDFAPHVGHTVTIYGMFLPSATASSTTPPNAGTASGASPARQETDFQVNEMEMGSDTCKLKNSKQNTNSSSHKP